MNGTSVGRPDASGTVATRLAEFLHTLTPESIPPDVLAMAKSCLLDTLGVGIAGVSTPWATAVRRSVRAQVTGGDATLWGESDGAPVAMAALANGTSAHSLDYDDDNALLHAGAAVVPAAIAVAEHVGASGGKLLTAIVAGYEASVRCAWALRPDALRARGFHSTGVCNPFGAAAAAAALLDMTVDQTVSAFGIAGSMSSGLGEFFEDGSMTKRLHAGLGAQSGVNAALLASNGFHGPSTVFEGRQGLCRAFSDNGDPSAISSSLGERFAIMDTAQKWYPVNFAVHAAIDAMLGLIARTGLHADQIESIVASVRPMVVHHAGHPTACEPTTVLAAQMSLPFGVATAIVDGTVRLPQITDEWIQRPELHDIARRISVIADPALDQVEGADRGTVLPVSLRITTTNGDVYVEAVDHQRGDPRWPLTAEQRRAKFEDCSHGRLEPTTSASLVDAILEIEQRSDVAPVFRVLRQIEAPVLSAAPSTGVEG